MKTSESCHEKNTPDGDAISPYGWKKAKTNKKLAFDEIHK